MESLDKPTASDLGVPLGAMASVNVATLEAEIDAMVYKLYELTAEEIAVVEGRALPNLIGFQNL